MYTGYDDDDDDDDVICIPGATFTIYKVLYNWR